MSLKNLIKCVQMDIPALTQRDALDFFNHEGQLFAFHNRFAIGSSATVEFAMLMPSNKIVEALPSIIVSDKELFIDFYQDVTLDDPEGTANVASTIRCMNQHSPGTSGVTELWTEPNILDYGETNYVEYIPASQFTAGSSSFSVNWITKPNVYYSVKIVNQVATAGTVKFSLYWIERDEVS